MTYGQLGKSDLEIADYSAVLAMPAAPAEQKAKAQCILAIHEFAKGDKDRAGELLSQARATFESLGNAAALADVAEMAAGMGCAAAPG